MICKRTSTGLGGNGHTDPTARPSRRFNDVTVRKLIVSAIAFGVVLIPDAASGVCTTSPFDQAVENSDAVLLGTIVDARALSHRIGPSTWGTRGTLVSINVEEVLKGSPEDGQDFLLGGCIPPPAGPFAQREARKEIGTQGLFLITIPTKGLPRSEYIGALTPEMSLDERIARAREVLGIDRPWIKVVTHPTTVEVVTIIVGVAVLLLGIGLYVARRRRA
jgi:hypothetical protein